MRTTIDIPDDLFRAAKAKAAIEGRPLKELVLEGLQHVIKKQTKQKKTKKRTVFPLIHGKDDGQVVTDEMVRKALDDFYEEEVAYYADVVRR